MNVGQKGLNMWLASFPRVIRLCAAIRFLKTTTQLVFFSRSNMWSASVAMEQWGSLVRFIRSGGQR